MNGYLRQAFEIFNEDLFDGSLQEDISIEINLNRKSILKFVSPSVVEIGSKFIAASKIDILDDLLHVMVHIFNAQLKIEDHTVNQYHNKHFCEKALSVGLIVTRHRARGWALTYSDLSNVPESIGQIRRPTAESSRCRAQAYLRVIWSDYDLSNFQCALKRSHDAKPQKDYLLKYICTGCNPPVIVRSGRRPDGQNPLNIQCNDCKTNFVLDCETI